MRDDPGFDRDAITACLHARYGIRVVSITFLPVGHDPYASVYEVIADDGTATFLKIRSGPVHIPALAVPRTLIDHGIPAVLAPLRTRDGDLWCPLDGHDGFTVVLYPFLWGENASVVGLTDDQWRAFGATLRATHDSGLGDRFRGQLRAEDFALPSASLVRRMLGVVHETTFAGEAAAGPAAFWRENVVRIGDLLARAEGFGATLRAKPFELVLCHGDIHAANILVGEDGHLWLVDWDAPLVAPRERDLLFVVGSRIARVVTPREEDLFFAGYGPVEIDPVALTYYRYERIVEDLGEFAKTVFLDPDVSESTRAQEAALALGFFAPGGDIDRAETVPRLRWPSASV